MTFMRNVSYAVRGLIRTPSFTLPAVVSLALAIALNATMFGILSGLLFRPVGPQSGNLVRIGRSQNNDRDFRSVSYDEYLHVRGHARSLKAVAGHQIESVVMTGPAGPEVISAEAVTSDYFGVLGVLPAAGRTFTAGEDRLPIAVISHRLWESRYAREIDVTGRILKLGGKPFTIVGVGHAGFTGTFPGVAVDVWLPALAANAAAGRQEDSQDPSLMLLGRLADGTSIQSAAAELDVLSAQLAASNPDGERNRRFVVEEARGIHPAFAKVVRVFLSILMAAVGVVLLIACANVTSLLMARAAARRSEIAVRLACGASRRQLVALLLVESLVLSTAGSAAGLLVSYAALRFLNALSPANGPTGAPLFFDLTIDARVVLFTIAAAVFTTIAAGLLPALQATRGDLVPALRGVSGRPGRSRMRGTLVAFQVAVSCVLLVAAVLLVRSLRHAASLDLGFDPARVVVTSFELRSLGYDTLARSSFYQEILPRVRELRGIEQAAWADFVPLGDSGGTASASNPDPSDSARVRVPFGLVSPGYFATVSQPLVRGRDFHESDRPGSPLVMIVNEALARRFFPGTETVGRSLTLKTEEERVFEIVGVVKDARFWSLQGEIEPLALLPAAQHAGPVLTLHTRTPLSAPEVLTAIKRLSEGIDPNVVVKAAPMRAEMRFALVPATVARIAFLIAGVVALLLAVGGLYGLVSYGLAQRVREIGIRAALGASPSSLFRLIVGRAVKVAAAGILAGLAIAGFAAQFLRAMLYGLTPTDPVTFGGVAAGLLMTVLAASYVAARKMLKLDPLQALRHEGN